MSEDLPSDDHADGASTKPASRRLISGAISLIVIGFMFGFALPSFADYGEVWDTLTDMTGLELLSLVGLAAFNLWTYLPLLTSVMPGLLQRQAFVVNNASTAISNSLPGGGALGVGVTLAMYRSWGFSNSSIGLSVIVSGIWNNFVKLGLPIVALAFLALAGEASASLVTASLIGVAILVVAIGLFGAILRSVELAKRVGRTLERPVSRLRALIRRDPVSGWDERAVDFRSSVIGLVATRWPRITAATVVSHLTLFAVLLLALRHVGVSEAEVSWAQVLASFAFGRLVTAIPVTPGGLGVIELGYVAALSVGVEEDTKAQVVAAVLLFRALTFIPPIIIGIFTYFFWQNNTSWRATPPDAVKAADASDGANDGELGNDITSTTEGV